MKRICHYIIEFYSLIKFDCIKSNNTRGTEFYREQWYAHQCQVNNPPQIIELRSTQDLTSIERDDRYQFYKKQFYAQKNA